MTLKTGVYNFIKWVALIVLPAAGTLYAALAQIWDLKYSTQVTNTVLAVDTFLGVIIGISSKGYTPPTDGQLIVGTPNADIANVRMRYDIHPVDALAQGKKTFTFTLLPDRGQVSGTAPFDAPPAQEGARSYD
jgi:hypothetical protein